MGGAWLGPLTSATHVPDFAACMFAALRHANTARDDTGDDTGDEPPAGSNF